MVYDGNSQKTSIVTITMNAPITFPPAAPVLKLTRAPAEKWAATLTEERRRLQEDQEALRERESNLRDYEARLRTLQAEIEAGRGAPAADSRPTAVPFARPTSKAPFADDAALQAAWEKLHRAREILEAEQAHLRDDRIAIQGELDALDAREQAVAAHEERIRQIELQASLAREEAQDEKESESTISRLTRAPFDIAKSVFGQKK